MKLKYLIFALVFGSLSNLSFAEKNTPPVLLAEFEKLGSDDPTMVECQYDLTLDSGGRRINARGSVMLGASKEVVFKDEHWKPFRTAQLQITENGCSKMELKVENFGAILEYMKKKSYLALNTQSLSDFFRSVPNLHLPVAIPFFQGIGNVEHSVVMSTNEGMTSLITDAREVIVYPFASEEGPTKATIISYHSERRLGQLTVNLPYKSGEQEGSVFVLTSYPKEKFEDFLKGAFN